MENEIFTPLLEQFMSSPLVTWVSVHFLLICSQFYLLIVWEEPCCRGARWSWCHGAAAGSVPGEDIRTAGWRKWDQSGGVCGTSGWSVSERSHAANVSVGKRCLGVIFCSFVSLVFFCCLRKNPFSSLPILTLVNYLHLCVTRSCGELRGDLGSWQIPTLHSWMSEQCVCRMYSVIQAESSL